MFTKIKEILMSVSLIKQIAVGLIVGICIACFAPGFIPVASIFGDFFVKALKGVAPVLVFFLVMNAMLQKKNDRNASIKPVIMLYFITTFLAALVGVFASFMFPTTLQLQNAQTQVAPPSGIAEVIHTLLMNIVDNPVNALVNANYIGILSWAIIIGIALQSVASEATKDCLDDLARGMTKVVTWVIHFAPFGIMGLVAESIGSNGLSTLLTYVHLLAVLIGGYAVVALIINPLVVYINTRQNPYPLIFSCLRESAVYAFFTRSSAANIPVNMALCKRLGLNPDIYSITIPLGCTINMSGAAITISVMALAAAHTLGIAVDFPTALLLCIVSAIGAAGTSGVAGGSLLLIPVACASFGIGNEIPLACSLFGIPDDISMQVVAVGFIISVLEDSCETALNSSSDVVFTATAEFAQRRKNGTLRAEDMVPKN